jgi:hypothetical protein
MKTLTLFLTLFAALSLNAQSVMDKLFEKYSGKEGYTTVNITREMFEMMAQVQLNTSDATDQKKIDEMKSFVSKIEGLRVISTGKKADTPAEKKAESLFREIMDNISKSNYKTLMEVKDGEQNVTFYVKRSGSKVAELIVVSKEKNETSLISLNGDIDLNKVSELTKGMNLKGLDKLENTDEKKK